MADFEKDLIELFGDDICTDYKFAELIYSALTNMIWRNGDQQYSATFRYVGGFIADIRGEGNYMDWYCCSFEGQVHPDIAEKLLTKGWTPHEYD